MAGDDKTNRIPSETTKVAMRSTLVSLLTPRLLLSFLTALTAFKGSRNAPGLYLLLPREVCLRHSLLSASLSYPWFLFRAWTI